MRLILVATTIALVSIQATSGQTPLTPVGRIELPRVEGRIDHLAVDMGAERLYVAALGNNTVEVLDLAAGKRLHSITGMSKPQGVLSVSHRNELAVANGGDESVKFLDATDFKVNHNLANMPDADNVRLDPHTGETWVGYGDGALARVLPGMHEGTIKLAGHPESFQLENQGWRIFVNVPDAKQIAVVDTRKDSVIAAWPMEKFQANFPMALDEPNHRLFIGCRKPARLVVLDTDTGKSVTDLEISGDTDDLFYDAKRKRLYISCGEGFIDIVEQPSPDKYRRATRIPSTPGARTSFFSPDLDRYYLAVPDRGNQKAEIRVYQPD